MCKVLPHTDPTSAYERAEQSYSPPAVHGVATLDRANPQQTINDDTAFPIEKPVIVYETIQGFLRMALKRSHTALPNEKPVIVKETIRGFLRTALKRSHVTNRGFISEEESPLH